MGGIGLEWGDRLLCELNFGIWIISCLPAEFKNFCFKLMHGRLYLNQQRARFADVGRWCTFCGIKKLQELRGRGVERGNVVYDDEMGRLPAENPSHLFWDCNLVNPLLHTLFNELAGTRNLVVDRRKYFLGWEGRSKGCTIVTLIGIHLVKYIMYKSKVRHRIPTLFSLKEEFRVAMGWLGRFQRWRGILGEVQLSWRGIMEIAD
jgi:hypothetical protein